MISDAYTQRCTCRDDADPAEHAPGAGFYCPQHGFAPLPPLPRPDAAPPRGHDYAQGLQQGFKAGFGEGFDAALRLMGGK